jgi:hypothetical protein
MIFSICDFELCVFSLRCQLKINKLFFRPLRGSELWSPISVCLVSLLIVVEVVTAGS